MVELTLQLYFSGWWDGPKDSEENISCSIILHSFLAQFIFEYGVARLDRLVFYNSYAIWREKMGEQGVNLQDSRYSFKAATMECTREFLRRVMCEENSKKPRNAELAHKRSTV